MPDPAVLNFAGRLVGVDHPTYIIAEAGINHNGSVEVALRLIDEAHAAGCDCVKFQKRSPERSVPLAIRDTVRDTPWGLLSYLDYRRKIELSLDDYGVIDAHARAAGIAWTASVWDLESLALFERFEVPFIKIPSAALTDHRLLQAARSLGKPIVLSTGMSTLEEIRDAVAVLGTAGLALLHCTSTYPSTPSEVNLRMIAALSAEFGCVVGYSGHETGLQISIAAAMLGASIVERHITVDRSHWGSDHAASLEPPGLKRLVRDIRVCESALGDGVKRVYQSELRAKERLRGVDSR